MTQFNPYLDFLGTQPQAAYFSYGDRFGGPNNSQRQRGYFQNAFSDIYQDYLGNLGRQARQGMMPMGQFNDFVGGFDFNKWYRDQVPEQTRNVGYSGFVPQTRWRLPGLFRDGQ